MILGKYKYNMKTFTEFLNERLYGFGTRNSISQVVKVVKPANPARLTPQNFHVKNTFPNLQIGDKKSGVVGK